MKEKQMAKYLYLTLQACCVLASVPGMFLNGYSYQFIVFDIV